MEQLGAFHDSDQIVQYDTAGNYSDRSPLSFESLPGFEVAAARWQRECDRDALLTTGPIAAQYLLAGEAADEVPNFPAFPEARGAPEEAAACTRRHDGTPRRRTRGASVLLNACVAAATRVTAV